LWDCFEEVVDILEDIQEVFEVEEEF